MRHKNLVLTLVLSAFVFASPLQAAAITESSPSYTQAVQWIKTPKELSKFMKKNFKFVFDEKLFGSIDYWQSPEEFWTNRKGDCEDYALFSKAILEKLGYKASVVSLYGADGYAHTVTVFEDHGTFNVMNEDRLYRFQSSNLEEAITRIFPDWTWGGIARLQGTRGWLVRELHNPSALAG